MQLLRKGGGAVDVTPPASSKWSYAKGKAAVTLIDLENGTGSCAAEGTKGMNAYVRGTVPKGSTPASATASACPTRSATPT